jgi:hypothetical protein
MAVDYGEDFLQRIVAVHWREPDAFGLPVFVYGMYEGNTLGYVKFKSSTDQDPELSTVTLSGEPPPDPGAIHPSIFTVRGGSYAFVTADVNQPGKVIGPSFLLIGVRSIQHEILDSVGNPTNINDYYSLIYRSTDGLNWSKVYEQSVINTDLRHQESLSAVGVVWDPAAKKFLYDQNHHIVIFSGAAGEPGTTSLLDQVFSSPDGQSWGMISSTETWADPGYRSSFPNYCTHNSLLDANGLSVPDGFAWQDRIIHASGLQSSATPPAPDIDYAQGLINYAYGSNSASIVQGALNQSFTVSIPGIATLTCLAGAGGILLAGGFLTNNPDDPTSGPGTVACSQDGGKTWRVLATTPRGVITISGGLL